MSDSKRPNILVVDDEPAVLLTYSTILRQSGYEATTASSVQEATQALAQRRYDLLVCDLALQTSRGGFEVLEFARALHGAIPAILLTGYAGPEVAEEAERQNTVVLFKPTEVRELLDTVARLLRRGGSDRAVNE